VDVIRKLIVKEGVAKVKLRLREFGLTKDDPAVNVVQKMIEFVGLIGITAIVVIDVAKFLMGFGPRGNSNGEFGRYVHAQWGLCKAMKPAR
jgi:hypothetical protein